MTLTSDSLFTPFSSAKLDLKNRLVMAPMTRSHSPDGIPGEDVAEYYKRRAEGEIGLIITSLKLHYNRPRPFQVAFYTEQNLHPYDSVSAQSPSYPSGHAMQSFLLCNIIAYHYEEKKDQLLKIAKQIADSRIIMGVHYPSDNAFGIQVVKELMLKEDIKSKYFPSVEENV